MRYKAQIKTFCLSVPCLQLVKTWSSQGYCEGESLSCLADSFRVAFNADGLATEKFIELLDAYLSAGLPDLDGAWIRNFFVYAIPVCSSMVMYDLAVKHGQKQSTAEYECTEQAIALCQLPGYWRVLRYTALNATDVCEDLVQSCLRAYGIDQNQKDYLSSYLSEMVQKAFENTESTARLDMMLTDIHFCVKLFAKAPKKLQLKPNSRLDDGDSDSDADDGWQVDFNLTREDLARHSGVSSQLGRSFLSDGCFSRTPSDSLLVEAWPDICNPFKRFKHAFLGVDDDLYGVALDRVSALLRIALSSQAARKSLIGQLEGSKTTEDKRLLQRYAEVLRLSEGSKYYGMLERCMLGYERLVHKAVESSAGAHEYTRYYRVFQAFRKHLCIKLRARTDAFEQVCAWAKEYAEQFPDDSAHSVHFSSLVGQALPDANTARYKVRQ